LRMASPRELLEGTAKNLAPLVFSDPYFIF
jgi:hypothetical protein